MLAVVRFIVVVIVCVSGGSCHPSNIRKSISIFYNSHRVHFDHEKNEYIYFGHRSRVNGPPFRVLNLGGQIRRRCRQFSPEIVERAGPYTPQCNTRSSRYTKGACMWRGSR